MFQFCLKRITYLILSFTLTMQISVFPTTPPERPQNLNPADLVANQGLMTVTQTATGLLRNILHQLPASMQEAGRNLLGQTMVTLARENIERFIVYKNNPINNKSTNHRTCLGILMAIASLASQLNKKINSAAGPVKSEDNNQKQMTMCEEI